MKILMVITEGDVGGAQRHVLDVSRELIRRGHAVVIAAGGVFSDLSEMAATAAPHVPVVRLRHLVRPIRPWSDVRAVREVYALVRKIKPDIVHAHSSKAGVIAPVAAWCARVPAIFTAHGFVFREESTWITRLIYQMIERCATYFRRAVIAVSQSDAHEARIRRVVPSHKLQTIYNGIDTTIAEKFLPREIARAELARWAQTDMSNARVVVAIANLYTAKNIPLLIRAFEFVVRRESTARLVVIGDGKDRVACEKIIRDTPILRTTVFLVGKRVAAFQILKGADLLVLSSTKEGLPYVILEAQLAGVPIVATRVGGIPEMQAFTDTTLVVPHSAELLSDAIVEALRRAPRGARDLAYVVTLRGMVDAIEAVYHDVLKKSSTRT